MKKHVTNFYTDSGAIPNDPSQTTTKVFVLKFPSLEAQTNSTHNQMIGSLFSSNLPLLLLKTLAEINAKLSVPEFRA